MSYEEEKLCTKQIDLFRWRFVEEQETYAIKIHGMILLKTDTIYQNSNSLLIWNPTKDCHQQQYNQQTYTKHETIKNKK